MLLTGLFLLAKQRFEWSPSLNCSNTKNPDIAALRSYIRECRVFIER